MTELESLLARVREARGPDRELGVDLMATLWPKRYRRSVANGGEDDGKVYLSEFRPATKWNDAGWYGLGGEDDLDPTASIDTAVALVEHLLPGKWNDILREALSAMSRRYGWHMNHVRPGQLQELPIAIVAALLQAKIALARPVTEPEGAGDA